LLKLLVHRANQLTGNLEGHILDGGIDPGATLLQGAEQIGPQAHHGALGLGSHPVVFEVESAAMTMPEGLVVMAGMLVLGQAGGQGGRCGFTAGGAEPRRAENPAGSDRRHAKDPAEVGESDPLFHPMPGVARRMDLLPGGCHRIEFTRIRHRGRFTWTVNLSTGNPDLFSSKLMNFC
jgi:hypothetical protein